MEPLKIESTNPDENKPASPGQKLEAVKPHPELIAKPAASKAETPVTQAMEVQRLYFSGIGAAIVIAIVALIVAISAKNGRLTDQNALVDAFANALAKNSAADKLQNSNAGMGANGTNSVNSANSANGGQNTGSANAQGMSNGGTNNTATGSSTGNGGPNSNSNGNTNTVTNTNTPNSNGGTNNGR